MDFRQLSLTFGDVSNNSAVQSREEKGFVMNYANMTEGTALIRVVGVGGGGGNAVNRMIEANITGVDFIAVNTDKQDLLYSLAGQHLLVGERATRGLGAGSDPEMGAKAAMESEDVLEEMLQGSDMVFVTATMGGGTGTGAAPIVAKAAKAVGALTIGVVTKPFLFEGSHKSKLAEMGIERMKEHVDTLIVIPNDKLLETADKRTSLSDSFLMADDILRQGIQGISELITIPGLINLDFADVQAIMSVGGAALMAIGHGEGDDAALQAAEKALSSNLLDVSIDGAKGVLFNVTGGPNLSLFEINQAAAMIKDMAHPDVNMIFGAVIDEGMGDAVRMTVIATGFEHNTPTVRDITRQSLTKGVTAKRPLRAPASTQPAQQRVTRPQQPVSEQGNYRVSDLDIPAFLRKKK